MSKIQNREKRKQGIFNCVYAHCILYVHHLHINCRLEGYHHRGQAGQGPPGLPLKMDINSMRKFSCQNISFHRLKVKNCYQQIIFIWTEPQEWFL